VILVIHIVFLSFVKYSTTCATLPGNHTRDSFDQRRSWRHTIRTIIVVIIIVVIIIVVDQ
jgi:hypothetical protein